MTTNTHHALDASLANRQTTGIRTKRLCGSAGRSLGFVLTALFMMGSTLSVADEKKRDQDEAREAASVQIESSTLGEIASDVSVVQQVGARKPGDGREQAPAVEARPAPRIVIVLPRRGCLFCMRQLEILVSGNLPSTAPQSPHRPQGSADNNTEEPTRVLPLVPENDESSYWRGLRGNAGDVHDPRVAPKLVVPDCVSDPGSTCTLRWRW